MSSAGVLDASGLRRRLISGSAWALGGQFGAAAAGLLSNVLLARLLTPAEFGAYLLVLSLVAVGSLVGCLGLNRAAVRFVAESVSLDRPGRARRAVRVVVGLGLIGAVAAGIAYALVGGALARGVFGTPLLASVVGLTAAWIVVSALQDLFAETFRGFHDVRLATLFGGIAIGNSSGLVMRALLLASLAWIWFSGGATDLATVLLIVVGSGSVAALVSGVALYARTAALRGPDGDLRSGEALRVSLPLLVNNLTVFVLMQSDIWILAAFRPPEEVAVYGAASRFMALVTMPLLIVNGVLPPVIAGLHASGERGRLERTMRPIATLAGVPALVALAVFVVAGGPILGLVYGDFYRTGATVLALLAIGKLVAAWAGSCGLTLQMTGNQTLLMWISILSGLVFVAGALWAVRDHGAVGVAAVAALSLAFQNLLTVLAARWKAGIWTHGTLSAAAVRKLLEKEER